MQAHWVLPPSRPRTTDSPVVSHVGAVLLTDTIRAAGLDVGLSGTLSRWRLPLAVHDPAKVLLDLALGLAVDVAACALGNRHADQPNSTGTNSARSMASPNECDTESDGRMTAPNTALGVVGHLTEDQVQQPPRNMRIMPNQRSSLRARTDF